MLKPKERDAIFHDHLGILLNAHGFGFKVSKKKLSWRSSETLVEVYARGSRYSTADLSIRWVGLRIASHAINSLVRKGVVDSIYQELKSHDVCDLLQGTHATIVLNLTDRDSCIEGAESVAEQFPLFWSKLVEPYTTCDALIDVRVKQCGLETLFAFTNADEDNASIHEHILHLVEKPGVPAMVNQLAILLGSQQRYGELRLLSKYIKAYQDSEHKNRKYMGRFRKTQAWLDEVACS